MCAADASTRVRKDKHPVGEVRELRKHAEFPEMLKKTKQQQT